MNALLHRSSLPSFLQKMGDGYPPPQLVFSVPLGSLPHNPEAGFEFSLGQRLRQ